MFKCLLVSISTLIITGCTISSSNAEEKHIIKVVPDNQDKYIVTKYQDQNPFCLKITEDKIKTCISNQGSLVKQGRAQCYACLVPYPDADKTCHDSSECIGKCYTRKRIPTSLKKEITGQCATNNSRFGCHQEIISGKAQHVICID